MMRRLPIKITRDIGIALRLVAPLGIFVLILIEMVRDLKSTLVHNVITIIAVIVYVNILSALIVQIQNAMLELLRHG
jgi:hypothetical protein